LERLNRALPLEAITAAVAGSPRDHSTTSPEAANREVYLVLKEGIKVCEPDKGRGGQKTERARSTPVGRMWWASSTACH